MSPYSNKYDRYDECKCLYSTIKADSRGRKKANRQKAHKHIINEIIYYYSNFVSSK